MDFAFRNMHADEIDVRVAEISKNGNWVALLLYKNARCDMAILDEAVTPAGWQREHYECKGNLFCRVGVQIDGQWIWKSDCGKEGNFEAEKSEASDSFKRACINWGIGRELYTAPRIKLSPKQARIQKNNNGRYACYDKFSVAKIVIENHVIRALSIRNDSTGRIVLNWMAPGFTPKKERKEEF